MISSFALTSSQSFLSRFRLPALTLPEGQRLPASIQEIWPAIENKEADPRGLSLRMILGEKTMLPDVEQGALHMALAASFLQAGDNRKARRHAEQSIVFYGRQWASRRILVEILMAQQAFEEALDQITRFAPPTSTPPWDHALSVRDWALCGAACAWRLRGWDEVARLIGEAYPDGPATMPALLLEDVFRLTLYRNQPDEAGRVAAILMGMNTLEFNDALLQTLVQQGWTNQALPLYRSAFTKDPRNALLRRRLVALCIREGNIEEARRLAAPGALDMNAKAT
jgi:tetratricopeptide (TPR) repeat protein